MILLKDGVDVETEPVRRPFAEWYAAVVRQSEFKWEAARTAYDNRPSDTCPEIGPDGRDWRPALGTEGSWKPIAAMGYDILWRRLLSAPREGA